jgi:hypothetical protein
MPAPVADAPDIVPWQAGAKTVPIRPESHRRLADEKQFALDRGNCLRVLRERLEVHSTNELNDHVDAVQDIS